LAFNLLLPDAIYFKDVYGYVKGCPTAASMGHPIGRDLISIEQPGISFRTYIFHRLMRASVTEWELVCV
jgi:hypothetical protein